MPLDYEKAREVLTPIVARFNYWTDSEVRTRVNRILAALDKCLTPALDHATAMRQADHARMAAESRSAAEQLERLATPASAHVHDEYGWTAQEWRDWSLKLSAMLPEEWDGDDDELSIIEDFVRHFASTPRYPNDEDEPASAQVLDRDALIDLLWQVRPSDKQGRWVEHVAQAILALPTKPELLDRQTTEASLARQAQVFANRANAAEARIAAVEAALNDERAETHYELLTRVRSALGVTK